ncbi:DUF6858 family protein [Thiomicrospira sp. WB1]|uniref:DUF6858 family protein n=1 Tax=Thiomicrospira sp. WB1 TaxID=1685380 RepID=UPI00074A4CE8|nr:hypothetical protein [Thiomicrospira sp. WB1]KUJ72765.1 hypothetical protein AVO41_02970 [Thiomicrospira sp. WB1]
MSTLQKKTFKDTYPIYELVLAKSDTAFTQVDQILEQLSQAVAAHPKATEIGRFDHFSHTQSVEGTIAEDIKDVKNLIFCFGWELPSPDPVAVRPRAIGITERDNDFVINFMHAPNPVAQEAIENWVTALAS